jgi:uncharacterized protein YjeT (DUF2065 family)
VLDPRAEYNRRIGIHQHIISRNEIAHRKIGNAKFAAVIAAIAIAILALSKHSFSAYWLFAPVAVYAALAILHERVLGAKSRAELAAAFYRKGLARMDDKWAGTGETGDRFRDPKHTYADDLDLFGRGCLFELLSTARLPMGENFLVQWLRFPSPLAAVVERQSLVAGLREKLDLRESLAVMGAELRVRLNPESLISWAEAKPVLPGASFRAVCVLLALLATATLALFLLTSTYWPLLLVLILEMLIYFFFHKRAKAMIAEVSSNAEGLILFSQILRSTAGVCRGAKRRNEIRVPFRTEAREHRLLDRRQRQPARPLPRLAPALHNTDGPRSGIVEKALRPENPRVGSHRR